MPLVYPIDAQVLETDPLNNAYEQVLQEATDSGVDVTLQGLDRPI